MDLTDYLIGVGVSVLLNAIKDPKKKAKVKAIALKVFTSIRNAYAGDPDFS